MDIMKRKTFPENIKIDAGTGVFKSAKAFLKSNTLEGKVFSARGFK